MSSEVAQRLAALEGAEEALILSSGTAALLCTMLALLRPGDHLLASNMLRSTTRRFLEEELPSLGIHVSFVECLDTRAWRRALTATTRVLFIENPALEYATFLPMQAAQALARESGLALVVDSTGASPVIWKPITEGADVVLHNSGYLLEGGQQNGLGIVCATDSVVEEVRARMYSWGAIPKQYSLARLSRAMDTLMLRVTQQRSTVWKLQKWAAHQPAIQQVTFAKRIPGLQQADALYDNSEEVYAPTMVFETTTVEYAQKIVDGISMMTEKELPGYDFGPYSTYARLLSEPQAENGKVLVFAGIEPAEWLIERMSEALK